jgi:hypothetical protein
MICKVFIAARLLFDKICEKNKLWHYVFTCVQYLRHGIFYLSCVFAALTKKIKELAPRILKSES